jgi:sugar phosphate isomerase/epimerase
VKSALGVSLWGFYFGRDVADWPTLAESVEWVAAMGEGLGVEVWPSRGPGDPGPTDDEARSLASACAGLPFATLHVRGDYWTWDPVALRAEIDLAARISARAVIVHPVCLRLDHPNRRPDLPEVRRILEYASDRAVLVALENTVDSAWALDRALDEFGDDPTESNLGICIDIGHAFLSSDAGRHPVRNYLERYAGPLVHLHIHDNAGEEDHHLTPGDGRVDWRDTQAVLGALGFQGTGVLEVRDPGRDPREAFRTGLDRLRASASESL